MRKFLLLLSLIVLMSCATENKVILSKRYNIRRSRNEQLSNQNMIETSQKKNAIIKISKTIIWRSQIRQEPNIR